jgi:hypothetical protein
MPRPRSLIVSMQWTQAGRGHDCRYNKSHRLEKGQRRLTIKSDGDEHHYCVACAKTFLVADIKRLQTLLEEADAMRRDPDAPSSDGVRRDF